MEYPPGTTGVSTKIYDYHMEFHSLNKQYEIKFTERGKFTAITASIDDKEHAKWIHEEWVLLDRLNYLLLKNKYSWKTTDKEGTVNEGTVSFYADGKLKFVNINNKESWGTYLGLTDIKDIKDIKDTTEYNVNFNDKKYKINIGEDNKRFFYILGNDENGIGGHLGPFE